jgi:hypothetical protein
MLFFLALNGGISLAQTCVAPPGGLTAWWTADNNLQDVVGGKIAVRNVIAFVPGNASQAFSLNGTTSFVQVNNANFLDPGTGSFSVEAWIKTSSLQSQTVFSKYECGGAACATPAYALFLNSGKLQFWVRSTLGDYRLNGTAPVADGNFHHVAVVRNAAAHQMLLYVDGALDGTLGPTVEGNLGDEDGEADPFVIGAMTVAASTTAKQVPFAGLIDEVSFYLRALTASEIQSVYLAGGAGKCKPFQLSFSEFQVARAPSGYPNLPQRLAVGSDGNLWYTEAQPNFGADRLGRITPAGAMTEFPAKQGYGITAGPDGALWSTVVGSTVGRMTTAGGFTEFPVYAPVGAITAGPDSKLWFFEWGFPHGNGGYGSIDRMTTGGVIGSTPWSAPNTFSTLGRIIPGPDGNLWFTEGSFGGVGKITTNGVITQYPVFQTYPTTIKAIAAGPDGRLWFTGAPHPGSGQPAVAAITTNGSLVYYVTGAQSTVTEFITAGPDGYLWATGGDNSGRALVRMNTAGAFSTYHFLDAAGSHGNDMIVGPDLCLWVTDEGGGISAGPGTIGQIIKACLPGPRVTGVSSPNADGAYLTGANLSITVTFDSPVFVTGVPRLNLNSGGAALYASGSGTNTLTFTYSVQAGENTLRLDGAPATPFLFTNLSGRTMAIQLNGGAIRDSAGIDALLMLPISPSAGSLGVNKQLSINPPDSTPPVSTAGTSPGANATGWYKNDVTVMINAVDNTGGSGVQNIQYTLAGAQTGSQTVTGASASLTISSEGSTTVTFFATDNAGNHEAAQTLTIRLDKTAPNIVGARTPLPNANGWNNTNVTVSFSCVDSLSGLAPGSPPADTVLSADGANQSVGGTCEDAAGNTASVAVSGINIDKTPPVAITGAAPPANPNGWNNTDVTVSFTGSDSISGIDFCTAATTLNAEASGQSASGTCTDKAGNVSAPTSRTINIDKTAPTASAAASPAANTNGWNNSNVTVSFTGNDSLSGIDFCTAATTLSAEGIGQSASGTCTDKAGNVSALAIRSGVNIDKTAPVASAAAAPPANPNGWNNTDVTVTFTGSDSLSGVDVCTAAVTLTVEGSGQPASGTCTDKAGNVSTPANRTINIDKTAPAASAAASPTANTSGWNNSNVIVSFTGNDTLSGIDFCTAATTLSAEGIGQSASGTCTDKAGNVSAPATKSGIKVDKTPPSISPSRAPAANPNGWNNTTVVVSFACSDALSGLASGSPPPDVTLSNEGGGQSAGGVCQDQAGNIASSTVNGINIDKTPPALSGSRAPAPNAAGWNNTPVTVTLLCTDALAGVAALSPGPSVVLSADGANQSVAAGCLDRAGNAANGVIGPISIDQAKPVVSSVSTNPSPVPPATAFTLNATVTENASGTDTAQYNLDGGPFTAMNLVNAGSGQWSASVAPLAVGSHTLCVRATDRAANQADAVCTSLSMSGTFWIGLQNSDDTGTQFDLQAELYKNGTLIATGLTRCITGVTRDPGQAKQVAVPFAVPDGTVLASGDVFALKMLTRVGTNPDGSKCSGPGGSHSNAVGLRLYYDSTDRPSRFTPGLNADPARDYYLHTAGTSSYFDITAPTGTTAKFVTSPAINFAGGNTWKQIGVWSIAQP